MTTVAVHSFTHSVTYVAENILKSLKDVVRLSGLDPSKMIADWEVLSRGLRAWIGTQDLERVVLEVFDPATGALALRWDIDIVYGWSGGDGSFWVDTEQLRFAVRKAGLAPADAGYRIVVQTKPWRPDVPGWSETELRSTGGMVRHVLGGTIEHSGLGAGAAYWRKT